MTRVRKVVKLQYVPRTDYLYVIGKQYFILYCIIPYDIISYHIVRHGRSKQVSPPLIVRRVVFIII